MTVTFTMTRNDINGCSPLKKGCVIEFRVGLHTWSFLLRSRFTSFLKQKNKVMQLKWSHNRHQFRKRQLQALTSQWEIMYSQNYKGKRNFIAKFSAYLQLITSIRKFQPTLNRCIVKSKARTSTFEQALMIRATISFTSTSNFSRPWQSGMSHVRINEPIAREYKQCSFRSWKFALIHQHSEAVNRYLLR